MPVTAVSEAVERYDPSTEAVIRDGIGLQKDGASAKPMTFTPLDGWFAYNLIKNLSAQ